jgi:hypothetical protein
VCSKACSIKSGDQGKFRPDQGIPLSSAIWAFALPTIVPTDLEPCREGEQGRPQMLEVAEADLDRGFVHPQACRKSLAERVDANDQAFRASRWRHGSRRTRPSAPSSP